jgi:hypothetical protein
VFPEERPVEGRRLVPQLAIGCIVFTLLGLLGTYWVANASQGFLAKHPFGRKAPTQP